jgi:hypothetical protein
MLRTLESHRVENPTLYLRNPTFGGVQCAVLRSLYLSLEAHRLCTVYPPFLGEGDRGRGNTTPSLRGTA